MEINTINLVGRAGREPDVRYFESGSIVANFTLAVNRRSRDEEPDWFNLEIWGKQAQIAADLAALFSKAKRNVKVPINLVKIKDLQKIKKGGPGCVSFKNGEIIWGNPTRGEDYI